MTLFRRNRLAIVATMAVMIVLTTLTPASASGWKGNDDVRNLRGLDYSLQNYFNTATADPDPATLIPFFEPQVGTVGRGVEISGDYIYDINLSGRSIAMTWNTAPQWDDFEPYVGKAGGLSQEQAAAAGIADEYHITFDEPVSHLRVRVDRRADIQPDVSFLDEYTLVISIPGGTTIGDGIGARVWLLPSRYRR